MNDHFDSHAEVEASASSVGTLDTAELEEDADTAASVSSRLLLLQVETYWSAPCKAKRISKHCKGYRLTLAGSMPVEEDLVLSTLACNPILKAGFV